MKESTIDLVPPENLPSIPYLVNRNVLKQTEIETATKYDRHINSRKSDNVI